MRNASRCVVSCDLSFVTYHIGIISVLFEEGYDIPCCTSVYSLVYSSPYAPPLRNAKLNYERETDLFFAGLSLRRAAV